RAPRQCHRPYHHHPRRRDDGAKSAPRLVRVPVVGIGVLDQRAEVLDGRLVDLTVAGADFRLVADPGPRLFVSTEAHRYENVSLVAHRDSFTGANCGTQKPSECSSKMTRTGRPTRIRADSIPTTFAIIWVLPPAAQQRESKFALRSCWSEKMRRRHEPPHRRSCH